MSMACDKNKAAPQAAKIYIVTFPRQEHIVPREALCQWWKTRIEEILIILRHQVHAAEKAQLHSF